MGKFKDEITTVIKAQDESAAELRKSEQARREILERERGRTKEQEQLARESARVQAEILDSRLRKQGRALEADLIRIRKNFQQRIVEARKADNAELVSRLRTLQKIREAEARGADARRREQSARATQAQKGQRAQAFAASLGSKIGVIAAVTAAAEIGRGIIDAIAAGIRGDIEQFGEKLQQIPVIGSIAKFGASLRELALGEQAEIERLTKLEKERTAEIQRRQTLIEANRAFESNIDALRKRAELVREESEEQRQLNQIARERVALQEQITKQLAATGGIGREDAEAEARALANAIAQKQVDEVRKAQAEAEETRARQVADIEAEITDIQLRRAGRVLDADLAANRRLFAERVRAAKEAGNAELASRLDVLAKVKAQEIRDREERQRLAEAEKAAEDQADRLRQEAEKQRKRQATAQQKELRDEIAELRKQAQAGPENQFRDQRFLTGVREQSQSEDRALVEASEKQIQRLEVQIETLASQDEKLGAIVAAIESSPALVIGGLA